MAQISNPTGGKYGCQDDPAGWYCPANVQPLVTLLLIVVFVSTVTDAKYY